MRACIIACTLGFISTGAVASTVYDVSYSYTAPYYDAPEGFTLSGTITTDGAAVLQASDLLDWNINLSLYVVSNNASATLLGPLSGNNSIAILDSGGLYASNGQLVVGTGFSIFDSNNGADIGFGPAGGEASIVFGLSFTTSANTVLGEASTVPLPATGWLLLSGLGGLGLLAGRRQF